MRSLGHQPIRTNVGMPFLGVDVDQLQPGQSAVIEETAPGYPITSLQDLPAGEYYPKAIFHVYYTEFHRQDGHSIWAHMDQWEGQHFNFSPGNLVSKVTRVSIRLKGMTRIQLTLDDVIQAEPIPENSKWVHRVKIKSRLLSKFWERPVFLGATILLPKGYETHQDVSYPSVYCQGHFNLPPPLGFRTDPIKETAEQIARRTARGLENGYQLYQSWGSENFLSMICVTFQHPTPFFDASYAVNSANNGGRPDSGTHSPRGKKLPHDPRRVRTRSYGRINRRL